MTTRFRSPALAAGLALLLTPWAAPAQPGDRPIPTNKPVVGEIAGRSTTLVELLDRLRHGPQSAVIGQQSAASLTHRAELRRTFGAAGDAPLFAAVLPVKLRAGCEVTVTVTAAGTDRPVGLLLIDPGQVLVGRADLAPRTATLAVGETAASGVHRLVVISDRVGRFTVTAAEGDGPSEAVLVEQLRELEREVERVKARLRKLRAKKP